MRRGTWTIPTLIALSCAVAAVGTSQGAPATTTATAGGDVAAPMTDANVLAMMHQVNTAEIDAAKLAEQKAAATSVKDFAKKMIHDHSMLNDQVAQVEKSTNITPQPPADDTLPQHAQHEAQQLQGLNGQAFDTEYVADQVSDHETALALLKQAAPEVKNAQVKQAVDKATSVVEEHLELAKKVQRELKPAA